MDLELRMTETIYISPWLLADEKVKAVGKSLVEAFEAWGIDYRMSDYFGEKFLLQNQF